MAGCNCNSIGPNSILGLNNSFIKYAGGDVVAQEGPTTLERLQLSDLRIPYQQILKTRVILKPGITNYLLNYTSLGDNATYLTLVARYDSLSRAESKNYVEYYYYTDPYRIYEFAQILTLSGNSTHRVPQIYLNNPNPDYSVNIDMMIAVIDDNTSFFFGATGSVPANALAFTGLRYTDIRVYDPYNPGPSQTVRTLSIHNTVGDIIAFLELSTINTLTLTTNVIIIDDSALGVVYFQFIDDFNALQAYSWLNYLLENPTGVTGTFSGTGSSLEIIPTEDALSPLVVFKPTIILPYGPTGITYSSTWSSTTQSFQGNTPLVLTAFGGTISYVNIASYAFNSITDNRDGVITFTNSQMMILDNSLSTVVTSITHSGTFSVIYNVNDNAGLNTNFVILLPVQ